MVKALQFLTSGYHQSIDDLLNGAVFHEDTDEMVLVRDIDLFSSCEHHILPIIGRVHVAYMPQRKSDRIIEVSTDLRNVWATLASPRTLNGSNC